jgi:FKBP12-rapamycin complex-associated protein
LTFIRLRVDELAEVDFRSHTVALARLADYLRIGLGSSDITVLNASARALGRLARLPITLVSDLCQAELKRALEALAQAVKEMKDAKQGQVEMKKTAALLILKALAADAPTMFYSSLPSFVELVWVGLRDAKQQIREIASDALGLALRLISERDNAEQWNRQIYAEANLVRIDSK